MSIKKVDPFVCVWRKDIISIADILLEVGRVLSIIELFALSSTTSAIKCNDWSNWEMGVLRKRRNSWFYENEYFIIFLQCNPYKVIFCRPTQKNITTFLDKSLRKLKRTIKNIKTKNRSRNLWPWFKKKKIEFLKINVVIKSWENILCPY